MDKKYKSTADIFAEQRALLLHDILESQREKKRTKEILQLEAIDIPDKQEPSPKRFALDNFVEKYPRRLKATKKKNRPTE
ncbi:TPA: hypothetical protein UZ441_002151 [Escherichia coli]|nr:hypothetical protein [Escherichia coli]HEL8022070.1 hypothetical protein [Escherichia coli]HEL8042168.1 hypothetical protein [Escherichia coli]HEL8045280.1 hypothetical protein [Escherichia coli]HEL8051900.1 hypothetical protein [Escherichia coli]